MVLSDWRLPGAWNGGQLIAALQAFGDRALAEKMAESMAPLAILGGESVSEVLGRLLRGTPLAKLLAPEAKAVEAGK